MKVTEKTLTYLKLENNIFFYKPPFSYIIFFCALVTGTILIVLGFTNVYNFIYFNFVSLIFGFSFVYSSIFQKSTIYCLFDKKRDTVFIRSYGFFKYLNSTKSISELDYIKLSEHRGSENNTYYVKMIFLKGEEITIIDTISLKEAKNIAKIISNFLDIQLIYQKD